MTLSILLTGPWDSKTGDAPPRLDVPKVRPHRFSWKNAGTVGFPRSPWAVKPQRWVEDDDGGSTEEAEVITSSSDESTFLELHGLTAKDANYDKLGERITEVEYEGIVHVIKEMAMQHPDAMWFVKSWSIESVSSD
ncbi:MAG TPA: hypothetical protein VHT92_08615 [Candidatus Cybelea sp.]|jgi:hypothetical protein|nr:hypothetical protein [Candidatus Cybelea sp.]